MKDNYGQELKVGDKVAWIYTWCKTTHQIRVGTIKEIIKKFGRERAVMSRYNEYCYTSVESGRIFKLPDSIDIEEKEKKYPVK